MQEIENCFIPLSDGRQLAARIWLPDNANTLPVPAILEYLPYRKRDGTAPRDESTYPVFADAGYAGVRVDISGNGESDGDYDDEYSPREHSDGLEVIDWIANQTWCDGNLGMMGISWGGFNSLQLAAIGPSPLKAVIAIGTTVDRYNDDIHYKNGAQLYSNFTWSSVMLCFASRPPDPLLVGDRWLDMWTHRLQTQPFPLQTWLAHQRRDEYWKHGSVCENYQNIRIPALVISGWGDGYINAPPAMVENNAMAKGINGPWIHKYPHFAWPKPRMDFHAEALRWWDQWLKGKPLGVDQLPAYRAYLSENIDPLSSRTDDPGHWVAMENWPSDKTCWQQWFPDGARQLTEKAADDTLLSICSPQDCGVHSGEFFPLKPDSELSGDQASDDAGSLVFDSTQLQESVDVLGRPSMQLTLSIDQDIGNICVRLNDVRPDGRVHRVSWGVLNLSHRKSQTHPQSMQPGQEEVVVVNLNECGYRFLPGHRIRVAISTAYWPMLVPPPNAVTASIHTGESTYLHLPLLEDANVIDIPEPTNRNPLPDYQNIQPATYKRWVEKDLQSGLTHFHVYDDTGEDRVDGNGIHNRHTHEEQWSIEPNNPTSYRVKSTYVSYIGRDEWQTRTVSVSSMTCDVENFYIEATVEAWLGEKQINQRKWLETIPRDFM